MTLALLALLGCPKDPLCVKPVDTSAAGLAFELGSGSDCGQTPVVRRVVVRRGADTVWSLSASDGVPLRTLRYGALPEGFDAARDAVPVAAGDALTIEVKDVASAATGTLTVTP